MLTFYQSNHHRCFLYHIFGTHTLDIYFEWDFIKCLHIWGIRTMTMMILQTNWLSQIGLSAVSMRKRYVSFPVDFTFLFDLPLTLSLPIALSFHSLTQSHRAPCANSYVSQSNRSIIIECHAVQSHWKWTNRQMLLFQLSAALCENGITISVAPKIAMITMYILRFFWKKFRYIQF